jgi:hypothetical protein
VEHTMYLPEGQKIELSAYGHDHSLKPVPWPYGRPITFGCSSSRGLCLFISHRNDHSRHGSMADGLKSGRGWPQSSVGFYITAMF